MAERYVVEHRTPLGIGRDFWLVAEAQDHSHVAMCLKRAMAERICRLLNADERRHRSEARTLFAPDEHMTAAEPSQGGEQP